MRRQARLRISTVTGATVAVVAAAATPAAAHGIGGRADLPVPLSFFVVGASAAVVISFLALAALWPTPRLQGTPAVRPVRARWLPAVRVTLQVVGLIGLGLVVADGLLGGNTTTRHINAPIVWVLFWLVVPYTVAVVGNYWLWASPWRTLGNWINGDAAERPDLGASLGVWPATAAFVAFTWLELVSPNSSDPGTLATAALVYTIYLGVATRVMGVDTGLRSSDAFENFMDLMAAISPISVGRRRAAVGATTTVSAATVAWQGWLRGLPHLPVRRGLTWFVIATIGTVTYDGMSGAEWWSDLFGETARTQGFGTVALVSMVLIIGAGYYAACAVASRLAQQPGTTVTTVADRFIHTLVPIALAYAFAHYFTLVLFEGQQLIHAASDPFGLGWNLFGTADWRIVFFLSPTAVWWVQLLTIVGGHIAATALAHDRALHDFGGEVAVRTQYAMLVLMVALTSLGLFILAG